MFQFHAVVSGHVQGVGFRYRASRHAKALKLKGFVKNLLDGRVEIIAQGKKPALERMAEWLQAGPSSGYVENVDIKWDKAEKKYKGFSSK